MDDKMLLSTAFEDLTRGFVVSIESLERIRQSEVKYERKRLS